MKPKDLTVDPYGTNETVLFSFRDPDYLVHHATKECSTQYPHHINKCGIMNKPDVKGFEVSTDYDLLWKLIHEGFRVPAYVKHNETIWDIVEVKMIRGRYNVGVRGISYSSFEHNIDEFRMVCEKYSLHFVVPEQEFKPGEYIQVSDSPDFKTLESTTGYFLCRDEYGLIWVKRFKSVGESASAYKYGRKTRNP